MKGYKGFEKGLICRGKQYAENTVFEEDDAVICEKGMHFCENPLDVLDYYPLLNEDAELNEFCEVEALDDPVTDDNKKFATKKLKIGVKLSFSAFVKAAIDFVFEKTKGTIESGDYARIASGGYFAQIASGGYSARITSGGDSARIASTGKNSVVCCIGIKGMAKAARGSWITLAEYDANGIVVCVKTEQVDGERIRENVFYRLSNGAFAEVEK